MGMLSSLSRMTMAVLGFVAVLMLHDSLMGTTSDPQAAMSNGEGKPAVSASAQSDDLVNIVDTNDAKTDLAQEGSDQDLDTIRQPPSNVMEEGLDSETASSVLPLPAVTDEGAGNEQSQRPIIENGAVPSAGVAALESSSTQWSAVWRPFFSPTTAQGFADYVSESTGLILRVHPSEVPGHYLVQVQHSTEAERIDADRRIVEFTGFQPPGAVQ